MSTGIVGDVKETSSEFHGTKNYEDGRNPSVTESGACPFHAGNFQEL